MQKSYVWKYFTREGDKARCKAEKCNALLTLKSTSTLSYHLEKIHNIFRPTSNIDADSSSRPQSSSIQLADDQQIQEPRAKKQKTILECFNIIVGEMIVETLVDHTSKLNSTIGKRFHKILLHKLSQRRNSLITSLALYIFDQSFLSKTSANSYPYKLESKASVQQFAIKLLQ